ncbi:MAG TPA: phytanoyl-CoA dioxygenase family protein [Caulobacter sp.]|nr:phytanoyl-CoA dioxygenase family protein [Caulobacter sp.]
MLRLVTLPPDASTDEIMAVLDRDGALIVRDVMDADTLGRLRSEIMPYVLATRPGQDGFSGFKTTRTGALAARSPACRDLIMNDMIQRLCERVLKPNCERWQLHLGQVIRIMPGQEAQPIHRDRWAWGPYMQGIEPQLNTIWAVSDFRRENGATQVAPGSITWPDDRRPTDDEITWAEMPAGSVLIYTGTVFHGGGANVSDEDRVGLNITYTLGWLRQEENQYLSCPPEIARTFPEPLQKMLGYDLGSYALGYYSPPLPPGEGPEVVSPRHALTGGGTDSALGTAELLASISEKTSKTTA